MKRQTLFGALVIVGIGVVLGMTVFRADIAQATGLGAGNAALVKAEHTKLVIQHTFVGGGAIGNIDVSKYTQIRVMFNPQGVTCPTATLTITGPAGALDEMPPCTADFTDRNKTYDVPGQSLELE